jgi:hypothetical protein
MSQRPTPADYEADLADRYRVYRGHRYAMPSYALNMIGSATRRALYAEQLLATIYRCTSIRSVHVLIEQSGIPGFDGTIPQEETKGVPST